MAIADFNHIKDVLVALDGLRPSRFGYTEAALAATGASEITALTGVYVTEDPTQINSIPTPDLIGMDSLVLNIGLRSQSATFTRQTANHFFGRLGLNLLKVTEKTRLLVENHLVNRYITPSGYIVEDVALAYTSTTVVLTQAKSPLSADTPTTTPDVITIAAAVSNGNAGVMTGADKKKLDDVTAAFNTGGLTTGRLLRFNSTSGEIESAAVAESAGALSGVTTLSMSSTLNVGGGSLSGLVQINNTSPVSIGLYVNVTRTVIAGVASATRGLNCVTSVKIDNAITDTGEHIGLSVTCLRNYGQLLDSGTLANLMSANFTYGHYSNDTSAPITTNAYGLRIVPYLSTGTITNMYDIHLYNKITGGTVTNHWGIYQQATNIKNYFGSPLGIGTTAPVGLLELSKLTDGALLRITSGQNDSAHSTTVPYGSIEFYSSDLSGIGAAVRGAIRCFPTNTTGSAGALTFSVNPGDGVTAEKEVMRITNTYRVGIGTYAPLQQFEITENFRMASTTSAAPYGVIYKGDNPFIHNFKHSTGNTAVPWGNNLFVGINAGNLTLGSGATIQNHGSFNSCFGHSTGLGLTLGYHNTLIGYLAGTVITDGHENTGIGSNSLCYVITGHHNTAIGFYSGSYYSTTSPLANPVNSVFIGHNTRASANGNTNEIVIGSDVLGNGSNTVTLGNDSITKTILRGDVGIGTTSPNLSGNNRTITLSCLTAGSSFLELQGLYTTDSTVAGIAFYNGTINIAQFAVIREGAADAGMLRIFTRVTGGALTERMRITSTGNVGIGGVTATERLYVTGNIYATGTVATSSLIATVTSANTGTAYTLSNTVDTFILTLTGSCTVTMPTTTTGQTRMITVVLVNDGTAARTVTFTGVKWDSGVVPTRNTAANAINVYQFINNGTTWYGFLAGYGMA